MRNLLFRFILFSFLMGCSCPDYEEDVLSIVEGQVLNCFDENGSEPILVFAGSSFETNLVDTIYPDSEGFFMHQFTSQFNIVYALPGDMNCSSASAIPKYGHKSKILLKQKTLFPALDLSIRIAEPQVDSFQLIIRRIGHDVIYDNLTFNSGKTSNWDTLQKVYRLCQGCDYLMSSTIHPNSQNPITRTDTLRIQDQLISWTINF